MTGLDLLKNAIGLIDETDTTPYEDTVVPKINLVLAETFDLNNHRRHEKDKYALTEVPTITAIGDTLTYETELLLRVLPLGLLCRLYVSEGNIPILAMYQQEYAKAIAEAERGIATSTYAIRIGG
jgi:hypothetical protein